MAQTREPTKARRKAAREESKASVRKIREAAKKKEVLELVRTNNRLLVASLAAQTLLDKLEVPINSIHVDDLALLSSTLKGLKIQVVPFQQKLTMLEEKLQQSEFYMGRKNDKLAFKIKLDNPKHEEISQSLQSKMTDWFRMHSHRVAISEQTKRGYLIVIVTFYYDAESHRQLSPLQENAASVVLGNSKIQVTKLKLGRQDYVRFHSCLMAGTDTDSILFSRDMELTPEVKLQLRNLALYLLTSF